MRVQSRTEPGRGPDAWKWIRIAVIGLGVVVLAFMARSETEKLLRFQPLGIDFMPMWAAGHEALVQPHRVYDFARLTRFETPLLAQFHGLRPFVYPPTALMVFAPFGLAPFAGADAAWTTLGVVMIAGCVAAWMRPRSALLAAAMILSPASVLVVLTGQVTFLVAALAVAAVFSLKTRPALAGVLFGLAAVIKPQALALAPVALLAIGAWRALGSAAITAALAALASVLAFGLRAWFDWLGAVARFDQWVMRLPAMQRGMITPTALGVTLHLDPGSLIVWRLVFAVGALVMVWCVFRATQDPARRLAALLGGGLFITPYAMHYDAALLAPTAALMLAQRQGLIAWTGALLAGGFLCCASIPYWGAAAVTGFILFAALVPERAFAHIRVPGRTPELTRAEREAAT